MKKVYSKFTKERKKEFQIVTSIIEDRGTKFVVKEPLTVESKKHIINMYDNYTNSLYNDEISLCPSKLENDSIIFDFINGKSYTSLLIECIEKKNKLGFIELLINYKKLVNKLSGNKNELFVKSKEFENVFGNVEGFTDGNSGSSLNIDLTFDNVIIMDNGKNIILDYEWIMNFSIPHNFVVYRAIHGLCVKYNLIVKELYSEEDLLDIVGISQEDVSEYIKMEKQFIVYVYGLDKAYETTLKKYVKEKYNIQQLLDEKNFLTQVFIDEGEGYSEETCFNFLKQGCNKEHRIIIDLSNHNKINSIRFDPINSTGIIKIKKACIISKNGELRELTIFSHNAMVNIEEIFVYDIEDPQIIYDMSENNELRQIEFIYEVIENEQNMKGSDLIHTFVLMRDKMVHLQNEILCLQTDIIQTNKLQTILLENKHCLEGRLNNMANEFELFKLNK